MQTQLFIKFGKKEHLEQLKKGIVHFSQLETFQRDPTSFRGDKMEGKHYLDPSNPFLINGRDFSGYIEKAVISYKFVNCTVLSFSASMLSFKNCHPISDGLYALNDSFIAEMRQFGDCFLVFEAYSLINALRKEFERTPCGYEYYPITYINKRDYHQIQTYYAEIGGDRENTAHLFVKDAILSYPMQNEWRVILFNHDHHYPVENGSTNIQTSFSTEMPIFGIDKLKTLQCGREFLCI